MNTTAQATTSSAPQAAATGTCPRILVVEDEPNIRLMIRTTLENSGYSVAESPNGFHART